MKNLTITILLTLSLCLPALAQTKTQQRIDAMCKFRNTPVNVDSDTAYANEQPPQKLAYKSKWKAKKVRRARK